MSRSCFLGLFYLLYVPTMGVPQPNNEGTYLIVNKTLIEAAAVVVLIVFDTGAIAESICCCVGDVSALRLNSDEVSP